MRTANNAILIKQGVVYPLEGNLKFFALHCLSTNMETVVIRLHGMNEPIEFSPGSFIGGALYPYCIAEYIKGDSKFMGLVPQKDTLF